MAKEHTITRFAGLAGVRAKPTVYVGPVNGDGLFTILREPCDNFVDRALKKDNKYGHIIFDPNGKGYWIVDHGPGIPVKKQVYEDERGRKEKLSQLYAATGLTHAGSNFDGDEASRGTHGLGIKCTNALSVVFKGWTYKDGSWYNIEYSKGKLTKDVAKASPPKLPHKIKVKPGTIIYFEPDMSIFDKGSSIAHTDVLEWCLLTSYLVPNLEVNLTNVKGVTKTFKSKGIEEYIKSALEKNKAEAMGKTFIHHSVFADVAISFANAENNAVFAYTNGLNNRDGGTHVKAVFDALSAALKPYKSKKDDYKAADLQDGLVGLINAKIAAPSFNNQRKDELIDGRAQAAIYPAVLKDFTDFFKKNKALAKRIIQRAVELRKKTSDFLKDKKLIKNIRNASKSMSDKFSDVNNSKTPIDERELFLVEGDSAAGPCKKARDKNFQAVFALRGKPLNVMDATKDKINGNKEVSGILAGIGLGSNPKNPGEIRFGKIIFLADGDIDGQHINTLLLTLFWKFTPRLFKEHRVYMVIAPEYYANYKKKLYFGRTKKSVYKQIGTTTGVEVKHLKGHGEASVEMLEQYAFNVKNRKLMRILPPENTEAKEFAKLMGNNPLYRQKMLGVLRDEK